MWITSECAVIQAPSTNYLVTSAAVELVSIGAEYAVMGAMSSHLDAWLTRTGSGEKDGMLG